MSLRVKGAHSASTVQSICTHKGCQKQNVQETLGLNGANGTPQPRTPSHIIIQPGASQLHMISPMIVLWESPFCVKYRDDPIPCNSLKPLHHNPWTRPGDRGSQERVFEVPECMYACVSVRACVAQHCAAVNDGLQHTTSNSLSCPLALALGGLCHGSSASPTDWRCAAPDLKHAMKAHRQCSKTQS